MAVTKVVESLLIEKEFYHKNVDNKKCSNTRTRRYKKYETISKLYAFYDMSTRVCIHYQCSCLQGSWNNHSFQTLYRMDGVLVKSQHP